MKQKLFITFQRLVPQHSLSALMGALAECRIKWVKNTFIRYFIKQYKVDLSEALTQSIDQYTCFNDFFIRELNTTVRPIGEGIVSPCDGAIAEIGKIKGDTLIQAKAHSFSLRELLGNDNGLSHQFKDGAYMTAYLAPFNYHRVHMPYDGKLIKTIYVPGRLFSVNKTTTNHIPNLYSLNERFISIFETEKGLMAVIMVGAMIVGSIKMAWQESPVKAKEIIVQNETSREIKLKKGDMLGYFKMGSTVILCFQKGKVDWNPTLGPDAILLYGQQINN